MNSVFSPLVKSLLVGLLAVVASATSTAAESAHAPAAPKIDPAKGGTLYTDGDAARVTVELGQHDTRQRQRIIEGLGRVDGILAQHGVDDKQDRKSVV